jgi:integration host factor subunit beta
MGGREMNTAELVLRVAERVNISQKAAKVIVDTVFEEIKDSLARGEKVEIRGFGNFVVKNYEGYAGRNHKTRRMEDTLGFQNRKDSIRLKVICPAMYIRFNNQGMACDQKTSRSMNVSQGGVRLQSNFPVDSGEILEVTMALGEDLIAFKGKVVYVTSSEDQGFEFGISIEDIENQDRVVLTRFIYYSKGSGDRRAA